MGGYRLQGVCFLITWSKSPGLTREKVAAHLESTVPNGQDGIKCYVVAQEKHKDGEKHHHAFIQYKKKKDIKDGTKFFDIEIYHPNIKPFKDFGSPRKMCNYLLVPSADKPSEDIDPNPIVFGELPEEKKNMSELLLMAVREEQRQKGAGFLHFFDQEPVFAMRNIRNLDATFDRLVHKRVKVDSPKFQISNFPNAPEIPDAWQTLYIWGDTSLGKTEWAKALLPGAYIISNMEGLKEADLSKGLIFDDMPVMMMNPTVIIHLCDFDTGRDIRVTYGSVRIPPGTRKIFTFNKSVDDWLPPNIDKVQRDAIVRRLHIINIKNKLY